MVSNTFKKLLLTSALFGLAGAATAATTPRYFDLGTLGVNTVGISSIQFNNSFDDYFTFVAGSLPSAIGSLSGLDYSDTGDLRLSYRFGMGDLPMWSDFSPSSAVPQGAAGEFALSATYTNLIAGQTYWANLKGTGTSGGYSVTLLPVPEPETYAMLLIGLGLMGVIARRRNAKSLSA